MKKQSFLKILALFIVAMFAGFGCSGGKSESKISLADIKDLAKGHALVVAYNDGRALTYDDNGIKPLFKHIDAYGSFKDSYVFDKVTGKASALILAYGGAARLYTGVLSKEAIPVLEKYNIEYSADAIVDYIINRSGDDKCPIEKSVAGIDDPEEAYKVLKEKFN
ncbi:MAG: DUF1893 domain-containing protein [Endomicrobia bacterium]|nr:DUF1893 domain-containing protein [Endomicrobiia bacterium]MCL2506261.1 DUF1893 domain-containing protein [Endomicrobiia bacterium]